MGCTTTTSMYLNISTEICASASTSRSGNTVTVSGTFSVNQPGGYNLNAIYAYVDGPTTWQRVKTANSRSGSANFSFSFQSSSAGSATYSAVFQVWNNAESGPVGGTASTTFSVSWPASGSAPSNGQIENLAVQYNGTELEFSSTNVSVSDGGLTLTLRRFEICEVPLTQSGIAAQIKTFTVGQPITLTQSDSTAHDGGITIVGNHLYYSGLCAQNSVGTYYYNGPSIVTPCEPASCTVTDITTSSATVAYSTGADGGYYDKTIEYSLDNGVTWTTGAIVTGGSAASGSFTIIGLTPGTSYTVKVRTTTTAGSTNGDDIAIVTISKDNVIYGSVNNVAERADIFYGSVSNQAESCSKVYGSVGGVAKLIHQGFGHVNYN